jgi:lambda family phage portal protein
MNFLDKMRRRIGNVLIGYGKRMAEEASPASPRLAYLKAAISSGLTADWVSGSVGADQKAMASLARVRARSRERADNDPHAAKYLQTLENEIVGPGGFGLQFHAVGRKGEPDDRLNTRLEEAWARRCEAEFATTAGRLCWNDLARLVIRTVACEGEALLQIVAQRNNPYGYALNLVSAEWLDDQHLEIARNGNRIIMGVELDDQNRPVAYWLRPPVSELYPRLRRETEKKRIPAASIIHVWRQLQPDATRGMPWMASGLYFMKMLEGLNDAAVTTARAAACNGGFFSERQPEEDAVGGAKEDVPESIEMRPGEFVKLPPGVEFMPFNPNQPTSNHAEFARTITTFIAAGLGIPYSTLSADLSQANYSSMRAGAIDWKRQKGVLQNWMIGAFCDPDVREFLRWQVLLGNISTEERNRIAWHWTPSGFDWVDPAKDMQANLVKLSLGMTTMTKLAAEAGGDFETNLAAIKRERELAAKYGVDLSALQMKKGKNDAGQT